MFRKRETGQDELLPLIDIFLNPGRFNSPFLTSWIRFAQALWEGANGGDHEEPHPLLLLLLRHGLDLPKSLQAPLVFFRLKPSNAAHFADMLSSVGHCPTTKSQTTTPTVYIYQGNWNVLLMSTTMLATMRYTTMLATTDYISMRKLQVLSSAMFTSARHSRTTLIESMWVARWARRLCRLWSYLSDDSDCDLVSSGSCRHLWDGPNWFWHVLLLQHGENSEVELFSENVIVR